MGGMADTRHLFRIGQRPVDAERQRLITILHCDGVMRRVMHKVQSRQLLPSMLTTGSRCASQLMALVGHTLTQKGHFLQRS